MKAELGDNSQICSGGRDKTVMLFSNDVSGFLHVAEVNNIGSRNPLVGFSSPDHSSPLSWF